jgi:hypothetical protein
VYLLSIEAALLPAQVRQLTALTIDAWSCFTSRGGHSTVKPALFLPMAYSFASITMTQLEVFYALTTEGVRALDSWYLALTPCGTTLPRDRNPTPVRPHSENGGGIDSFLVLPCLCPLAKGIFYASSLVGPSVQD